MKKHRVSYVGYEVSVGWKEWKCVKDCLKGSRFARLFQSAQINLLIKVAYNCVGWST